MENKKKLLEISTEDYTYSMIETTADIQEAGRISVYGIEICGVNEKSCVEDISCELEEVKHLFALIVEEKVFPEHLCDIAEDFISR